MLHVNDDNNDELFRKAASDFYLGPNNPDWAGFVDKMEKDIAPSVQETVNIKKRKKYPYLLLPLTRLHLKMMSVISAPVFRKFRFGLWRQKGKKKINTVFYYAAPEFAVI